MIKRKPASASVIRSMMCRSSFKERDSRSSLQTTKASASGATCCMIGPSIGGGSGSPYAGAGFLGDLFSGPYSPLMPPVQSGDPVKCADCAAQRRFCCSATEHPAAQGV